MMRQRVFLLLVLAWLGLSTSHATTYYIGSGGCNNGFPGTDPGQPKCELTAALQTSLAPGDTVYFRAGSHQGFRADETFMPSGTSESSRITFAGYPGEVVTLTPNGNGVVTLYTKGGATAGGLGYITLDNFIMDGQRAVGALTTIGEVAYYSFVSNMHHIRVSNSIIKNSIGTGIHGACDFCEYLSLRVHDHGSSVYDHGFYLQGKNLLLDGIEAYGNSGAGIQIQDYSCSNAVNLGYIAFGECHATDNAIVRNSYLHGNGFDPVNPGLGGVVMTHGYNGQIYNNILAHNAGGGASTTIQSFNAKIYNNTMVGGSSCAEVFESGSINTEIKGNICYGAAQPYYISGSPSGLVIQQNLDTGADPKFAATSGPNLYMLQDTSPARNALAPPCLVSTDYLNQSARPLGSGCDQGAREYPEGGGVPPNGNPIYLSDGTHGDAPSNGDGSVQSCIDAENPATPKATWAGASVCMTVPGKKMIVRGGTYVTTMDTLGSPLAAGTVALPTTVEAAPAEVPVFQLPSGQTVLLNLRGANDSHLKFKGLTLDAMNRTNSNVFQIAAPGNNITFEDVIMRQATNSCGFMADVSIIELRSDPTLTTTRGRIENCGLDGLKTGGTVGQLWVIGIAISNVGEKGINAGATSGTVNTLFVNRAAIHHTGTAGAGHAGIEIATGSGAVVQNTLLYRNQVGVRVRSGAMNARIDHVTAATSNGVGIQCDGGATTIKIRHNLVFGNGTAGITNNCGAPAAPNWITEPLFTNAPGDDYTLLPTSTAINTVPTLPEVTGSYLPGVDRPQGIASDPGAYEQDAPLPPPDPLTERRVGVHTPSFFQ